MLQLFPAVPAPIKLSDGTVIAVGDFTRHVTEDDIAALIQNDDRFISVALVILYNRQTADERVGGMTKHDNARGFNAFDARSGTYFAKWASGQTVRNPDSVPSFEIGKQRFFHLTGRHLANARRLVRKYRKQLADAFNANGGFAA